MVGRYKFAALAGAAIFAAGVIIWRADHALDTYLYLLLLLPIGSAMIPAIAQFTDLGGALVMISVAVAACVRLIRLDRYRQALWLFATVASGRISVELIKIAVGRARPPLVDHLAAVSSASFPSSHSAGSMLTGMAVVIAFGLRRTGWAVILAFTIAIGISRVMLGVHWPSDVLAGWGLGMLWAAAAASLKPAEHVSTIMLPR